MSKIFQVLIIFITILVCECQKTINLLNVNISYTYNPSSTTFEVIFPFPTGLTTGNAWVALGFNTIQDMGGSNAIVCKSTSSGNSVVNHLNTDSSTALLDPSNPTLGITNSSITISSEKMICTFTRANTNSNSKYFNIITTNPYILLAYGTLSGSTLNYHISRTISTNTVNFNAALSNVATTNVASTRTPSAGVAYGAYSQGSLNLEWKSTPNFIDFTIKTKVSGSTNIYSSIGFSYDQKMGSDGVIYCTYSDSSKSIFQAYNNGKSRPNFLNSSNPSVGLSNITVRLENGNLICSCRREKKNTLISNYFDLNNEYYLLFAQGLISDGSIQFHTEKSSSISKIDFLKNTSLVEESDNKDKLKAHACIMVIFWMAVAPTGILFARYYKFIFPKVRWFDLQFWFNMHRPMMIMVPIASVVAFIVILSDLDWNWVGAEDKTAFAHSIFGIITICLSVIQIPIAFARPKPDHSKRFIFNWVHRSVGLTALLFSIIALFIGVCIEDVGIKKAGWSIMIGYVCWLFILLSMLEGFEFLFKKRLDLSDNLNPKNIDEKETEKENSLEMDDKSIKTEISSDKIEKPKKPKKLPKNEISPPKTKVLRTLEGIKSVLLVFHLLIIFSLTLSLVIVIGIGKHEEV